MRIRREPDEVVWEGADALRELLAPVRDLEPHPQNPRRGDAAAIAASLARFGQVRPVLTNGRRIIVGNHTWQAARDLGWTHVAVVRHDFASEQEARAYLLADNRLADLGDYEREELVAALAALEATGSWSGTGYDADDLDDLRAQQDAIAETDYVPFAGGYVADPEELARRANMIGGGGPPLTEILLLMDDRQHAEFDRHVRLLRREYGGDGGVTDTVARAVREAAERA